MAFTIADERRKGRESGFIDRTEEDEGKGFGLFPAPPEEDVVQRALRVLQRRLRVAGPSRHQPASG